MVGRRHLTTSQHRATGTWPQLGQVHLYLSPSENAGCEIDWLSPAEFKRAGTFRHYIDQTKYIAAHRWLRFLLARYIDVHPASLIFDLSDNGKPALRNAELTFNLSHSANYIAVAVGRLPLGVDVEERAAFTESDTIASEILTPNEFEYYTGLLPSLRAARLSEFWTVKEAVLKATGEGLSRPPRTVQIGGCSSMLAACGIFENIFWRSPIITNNIVCSVAQMFGPFEIAKLVINSSYQLTY